MFVCRYSSSRLPWLQHWLTHTHGPVRLAAARLVALAAAPAGTEALLQQLLGSFFPLAAAADAAAATTAAASSSSGKLEEQEASMLAAGAHLCLLTFCTRGSRYSIYFVNSGPVSC
jgi:hypothetical protein